MLYHPIPIAYICEKLVDYVTYDISSAPGFQVAVVKRIFTPLGTTDSSGNSRILVKRQDRGQE